MAVDYDEGRRLLAEVKQWETRKGTPEYDVESHSFAIIRTNSFVVTHAEALLNPDPWRPIGEAPKRLCMVWGPEWSVHIAERVNGEWTTDGGDYLPADQLTHWMPLPHPPTHFRELKGPGHV